MKESERRRYFRINDTVGLTILSLNGKELLGAESVFSMNPLQLINEGDNELEELVSLLKDKQPEVSRALSLMNQKLERVANLLALESNLLEHFSERIQEVNISACGLAFTHHELLLNNTMLDLQLTLYPDELKIRSRAKVVRCEKNEHELWRCRVDFIGMSEEDQERLIRHIVQNQSSMLKDRASHKNEKN
ncbi:PilZ domain-containing protein [Agaribacterium sp. ZY112]|uniref:PilZ domain-containing protein n=1 Tax=Agaribacterium sp. ZY112 TaxID=3233574 RepID=UPI0035262105